jgi:hypothetical protein
MRRLILRLAMVILVLALGLGNARAVSVSDRPVISGPIRVIPPNFDNMVCVPEPASPSRVVRMICYTTDQSAASGVRPSAPSRSGSEILRDLYRERDEIPWWQR